jgi:predicted ATPase
MKLTDLRAVNYRSLQEVELEIRGLDVLIGANASGKSNVLDALMFLGQGVSQKDFGQAITQRGGIVHLAWKGEVAHDVSLETQYQRDENTRFTWSVRLRRVQHSVVVTERVVQVDEAGKRTPVLEADEGNIWWSSPQAKNGKLKSTHGATACGLASAVSDVDFPARDLAQFVARWSFFDPTPASIRRAAHVDDDAQLSASGSNLAARLYGLEQAGDGRFERILRATQRVLGVPDKIEFRVSEEGRVYFVQSEPGLSFQVHQIGASSGTLRMLALMTALYGEDAATLVGIEEPENHVHPKALNAFAEYLRDASKRIQLVITTHSSLLLDCLPKSDEVVVVRRTADGTRAERVPDPGAVDKALEESGFGLGEFFETTGFGAPP